MFLKKDVNVESLEDLFRADYSFSECNGCACIETKLVKSLYENNDTTQSFIILNAIFHYMTQHSKFFHLDKAEWSLAGEEYEVKQ